MSGPIKLDTNPRTESITLNSLVQTDNKLFNKVIMIFAYLCDQVATLKQQAQAHFFEPLLLAAEGEDLSVEGEPSVRTPPGPYPRDRTPKSVARDDSCLHNASRVLACHFIAHASSG